MKSFKELEKLQLSLIGGNTSLATPVVDSFYDSINDIGLMLENSKTFNKSLVLAFYKNYVELFSDKNQEATDLMARILVASKEANERVSFLSKYASEVFLRLKVAQLLEASMANYLESINLNFTNDSLVDKTQTTALVNNEDGLILGIPSQPSKADKSVLNLEKIPVSKVFATFDDFTETSKATVLVNGQLTADSYIIVNTNHNIKSNNFAFVGDTKQFSRDKTLSILIDRTEHLNSSFNNIEIGLDKPHIIDILVSDDLEEYRSVFARPVYLKEVVAPCGNLNSRYIKIIISKASGLDYERSGSYYKYKVGFKYINICKTTVDAETVFVSNGIELANTAYTGLSIDTCDNYQDKNVSLKYYIDVGKQERWKEIRPINKVANNIDTSSVFLLNDFYDNKIVQYSEEPTKVDNVYEYQLELDGDFISSNNIRVFGTELVPGDEWKGDQEWKTISGVLYAPTTLHIDPEAPIYINGKITNSSLIPLDKGIYKLRIPASKYLTIYNSRNVDVVKDDDGLLALKNKASGVLSTIYDQLYPFNYKRIIEDTFDFLFEDELIEKRDYYLYNKDSTYFIRTNKKHSNINLVYRLYVTNLSEEVNSFRIKAVLKSLDKVTIPYIERILVKCS